MSRESESRLNENTHGKSRSRFGTGIAVDKMLALTGQAPMVAVQVNLPSVEERARLDATDAKLDEITRRLAAE